MKKSIGVAALIVVCFTQTSFVEPVFGQRRLPSICNCKGHNGPGGACYAGPGGPAYDGPVGPAYNGLGGTGRTCPAVCR